MIIEHSIYKVHVLKTKMGKWQGHLTKLDTFSAIFN